MPSKKVDDDNKVMDVSKPGKGKIITTSRPVVAPIVSTEASTDETTTIPTPPKEEAQSLAPSASHKVIQPLNSIKVEDTSVEESIKVTTAPSVEPEPATDVPSEEETKIAEPATDAKPDPEKPAEAEPVSAVKESIPPPTEKTAPSPSIPKPQEVKPPEEAKPAEETKPSTPAASDAAGVEALAGAAEAKKLSAKEAEEQAKRDAAVQELINSKKYFVPIGGHHEGPQASVQSNSNNHSWTVVVLLVVLALAVAGYLLNDAGVVDMGFEPPYELIKN